MRWSQFFVIRPIALRSQFTLAGPWLVRIMTIDSGAPRLLRPGRKPKMVSPRVRMLLMIMSVRTNAIQKRMVGNWSQRGAGREVKVIKDFAKHEE